MRVVAIGRRLNIVWCRRRRHWLAVRKHRCKKGDTFGLDSGRDGVPIAFSIYKYDINERNTQNNDRRTNRGSTFDRLSAVSSSDSYI